MPDELTQDEKFKLRKILYHVYDEELRADRDTEIACLHEDIAKLRQQLAAKDAEIERLKWQWAEDSVDIDKALTAAGEWSLTATDIVGQRLSSKSWDSVSSNSKPRT